jgi:hypothetical protein
LTVSAETPDLEAATAIARVKILADHGAQTVAQRLRRPETIYRWQSLRGPPS